MIVAVGTDIVSINRIRKAIKNPKFARKILNKEELQKADDPEFVAGRWAAKEALIKCLGGTFKDFTIPPTSKSPPQVTSDRLKNHHCHLSISHEREFAVAFVIIEALPTP